MRIFASLMPVKDVAIPDVVGILKHCVDGFHVDVMDGKFVSAVHGSLELVSQVSSLSDLPVWIHLMVQDPLTWINRLDSRQGAIISIHYEACKDETEILHALSHIREKGAYASLAINPTTPIEAIEPYVSHLDQLLLMGVHPGKSGQTMLAGTKERLQALYQLRGRFKTRFCIALDGGITPQALALLLSYFPDDIAAASFIIQAPSPCTAAAELREVIQ